jgi:hypothetical protein
LGGCFDLEQSISVDSTRASYTAEFRLDAKLAALATMGDASKKLCDDLFRQARADTAKGVQVETSETSSSGNVVCKVQLSAPTVAFAGSLGGSTESKMGLLKVERIDESTFRIENRLNMGDGRDRSLDSLGGAALAESLFAGRALKWTVQAPRVLESNGTIASDGRSVQWSVPVSSAMKAPQQFYAVVVLDMPWYARVLGFIYERWRALKATLRGWLAD